LLSEDDLFARIIKVKNLKENCFKYLEEISKELLTQKIIFALSELTAEKMGPVKLSEIAKTKPDKTKPKIIKNFMILQPPVFQEQSTLNLIFHVLG